MIYGTNSRKKEFDGKCIVAFVDILGFSNEIINKWKRFEEDPILRLHNFTSNVNANISKQLRNIKSEAERDTYYGCKIITFSDSVIITYAFNGEPKIYNFLVGLYYVLYTTCNVWKIALRNKFTVRGGIDFGEMHWDSKVFAGPAFISAHEIECKVSISSRITFGNKLVQEICNSYFGERKDDILELIIMHICHLVRPFLYIDCDEKLILSPQSLYKNESERIKLIREVEQMQEECLELKNKLKYVPLLDAIKQDKIVIKDSDLERIMAKLTK